MKPASSDTPIKVYWQRRNAYKKAIKKRLKTLTNDHSMIVMYRLKKRQHEWMIIKKLCAKLFLLNK